MLSNNEHSACAHVLQSIHTVSTGCHRISLGTHLANLMSVLCLEHISGTQADHLKEKDNFALLEQARVIYSAGFFLTASAESMLVAAKHAAANNKIYCINISAPFLLQVC